MGVHGEEDIFPLHPPKTGHGIADGKSPGVASMQVAIKIGIRYGQKEFLPGVRLGLEDFFLLPDLLPFGLDLMSRIIVKQLFPSAYAKS